jgi:hypothetical protein
LEEFIEKGIYDRNFFSENVFRKMTENSPQETLPHEGVRALYIGGKNPCKEKTS